MRRLAGTIAIALLIACLAGGLYLHLAARGATAETARFPEPVRTEVVPASKPADLALDHPRSVALNPSATVLQEFTPRERRDQYLDWLLFAVLSAAEPSPEEYTRTLFDLPAVRYGYMRPLANLEFGDTRSRFIGNGTVLALVPATANGAARKDDLAHIADEHRKNLAGGFDRIMVVEYDLDVEHATATVTHRADVKWDALFSPEYGYVEQRITNADDFAAFMSQADDLSTASKTADALVLGGRKIFAYPYRRINVEMVATVWQAEAKIKAALDSFESHADSVVRAFNARWSGRTYRTSWERQQLEQEQNQEWEGVKAQLQGEREQLKLVNGSGFSLDPAYDFDGLGKDFPALAKALHLPDDDVKAATDGFASKDIVPLLRVRDGFEREIGSSRLAELSAGLLQEFETSHKYQGARYDGDLQGTEVGMVLFYTDLLAKLWTSDVAASSPTVAIADFMTDPDTRYASIYEQENTELPNSRLWFGKFDSGFQLGQDQRAVYLSRIATRVYSAGSNPLFPGREVQTSILLGQPIAWWNDHYEEVARYEQEYERLNQIMKWSIVIGWLNAANDAKKLGFLADVQVDRSKRLPTWAQQHPELRFKKWDQITFKPDGYLGTTTETLPILDGRPFLRNGHEFVVSGGVSLAPKEIFRSRATIAQSIDRTMLRSNIDYGAEGVGARVLKTFDSTVYRFETANANAPGRLSVVSQAKPEAKLRAPTAEIANDNIVRVTLPEQGAMRLETKLASAPIGDLDIASAGNGFKVGWRSRELDYAQGLARRVSRAESPLDVLARDAQVESVIGLTGKTDYLVKLRGSDRLIHLAEEAAPSRDLATGWQMRVADLQAAKRDMQVLVLDYAQAKPLLGGHQHLVLDSVGGDFKAVAHLADGAPPQGTKLLDVRIGDRSYKAWVDSSGGVHVEPGAQQTAMDVAAAIRNIGRADLDAIRAAAKTAGPGEVRVADASVVRTRIADAAGAGNPRELASDIVADPAAARKAIEAQLQAELGIDARIMADGGAADSIAHLDGLVNAYGPLPELTLLRALRHIENGRWTEAVDSLGQRVSRPLESRNVVFDEINARLADSRLSAIERDNLAQFADYASFQDALAARDAGDVLRPHFRQNAFGFDLKLNKPLAPLKDVDVAALGNRKAVVYRQDSPGLNNVDWSAPTSTSLRQVVSGRLGRVVQLPRGDIASFRPSAIYMPDGGTVLRKVNPSFEHGVSSSSSRVVCNPTIGPCANDNPQQPDDSEVYLVLAD
jgi:hypothetical protein